MFADGGTAGHLGDGGPGDVDRRGQLGVEDDLLLARPRAAGLRSVRSLTCGGCGSGRGRLCRLCGGLFDVAFGRRGGLPGQPITEQ
jgi:hypothetical protein